MRSLTFIFLFLLSIGCGGPKNAATSHHKLNGTWVPIRQEIGGKSLPKMAFEKQQLIVSGFKYTFTAESVDKGELKFNNGRMDIYGKEGVNTGKHFTAIYKFENGELTICYNLKGDSYPETFDTKGKPLYFLCVFKKS